MRWFAAVALAGVVAAACDHAFEPFENQEDAVFSMFGYLDLKADTQWVRVMPVREQLFLEPGPIDAVVTLEHLGSGRVVTLRDSLFRFEDPRLGAVAYAHNFWTTERLAPGASYRLTAVRSDGAASTALVVMPAEPAVAFLNHLSVGPDNAYLEVRTERVLFVEVLYTMSTTDGYPVPALRILKHATFLTDDPATVGIGVRGDTLQRDGLVDRRRQEIRLTLGRTDWPYHPDLSDVEVAHPGVAPSNVENGLGFVGGVVRWTIPFARCEVLAPRPRRLHSCVTVLDTQSAAVAGRLLRQPCGEPHALADVLLTERFEDGGAIVRAWKTGWDGSYRFEGVEPGADLVLDLGPGAREVHLPRLAPGERHRVEHVAAPGGC